jgi:hypothetical protein
VFIELAYHRDFVIGCTGHPTAIMSERNLERVLSEYVDRYNLERPHRASGCEVSWPARSWPAAGRGGLPL